MSRKKIKIILLFLKKNRLPVIATGIAGSIIVAYGCFFVPRFYTFWPNVGLDDVATSINRHDPNLFVKIGNSYFGNGKVYDIKKAKKAYVEAIKLDPNLFEPHYQLGRIHFINANFIYALIEMDKVINIDPDFQQAYYMKGLVNGYQGNLDEAVVGFEEFIKRDDFNWAGYNDLAWIYFKKGEYEKVREIAGKGLEKAQMNPWLNNIYGTALMNLGEKEEAKKYFQIALKSAEGMSPEDWGRSYPGNNPAIYAQGLEETKSVIRHNMMLVSTE